MFFNLSRGPMEIGSRDLTLIILQIILTEESIGLSPVKEDPSLRSG